MAAASPGPACLAAPRPSNCCPSGGFFVDAEGRPVEVDALEPAVWLKQGWGSFGGSALREDEAYRAQTVHQP